MRPKDYGCHDKEYNKLIENMGLSAVSPEDRVRILTQTPCEKLIPTLFQGCAPAFAVDGDIIPVTVPFIDMDKSNESKIPGKEWCSSIMIGSASDDVSLHRGC